MLSFLLFKTVHDLPRLLGSLTSEELSELPHSHYLSTQLEAVVGRSSPHERALKGVTDADSKESTGIVSTIFSPK